MNAKKKRNGEGRTKRGEEGKVEGGGWMVEAAAAAGCGRRGKEKKRRKRATNQDRYSGLAEMSR